MAQRQIDEIREKTLYSDIILSDFFDTILCRDISDNLLLNMWADSLSTYSGFKVSAKVLVSERHTAARNLFKAKENVKEITYCDLISELNRILQNNYDVHIDNLFETSLCLEEEINLSHLSPNMGLIDLYRELKQKGKRIYIVSDYVLPRASLIKFLKHFNLNDIFTDIFVSSEYGCRKADGSLYKVVFKKLGAHYKYFMIGDNPNSDCKMAIKYNMDAYCISKLQICKQKSINVGKALREVYESNDTFSGYAFGFYIFIDRLYHELTRKHYNSILFFSREGYDIKRLFDFYQAHKILKISSKYIYVSRKATLLGSLLTDKGLDFSSIKSANTTLSLRDFLRNISMENDIDRLKDHFTSFGYGVDDQVVDFFDSEVFRTLLLIPDFNTKLKEMCIQEREKIKNYILQNLDSFDERIAICDIGWKGTIQDNIFCALNGDIAIDGYYYGLESVTGKESIDNTKTGLLFSCDPHKSKFYKYTDFETHLIEQLLCAPHGSTVGYSLNGDKVVPELAVFSADDQAVYESCKSIKKNINRAFEKLCHIFECSADNSYSEEKNLYKYFIISQLSLNEEAIEFERIALNSKTNNFGHFSSGIRNGKNLSLARVIGFLKRIFQVRGGLMCHLNYVAVKMNARGRYKWKIKVYRIVRHLLTLSICLWGRWSNDEQK